MKFDRLLPNLERPPVCWILGEGVEPAELSELRQLGLRVRWAERAPRSARWVCSWDHFTFENLFQAWRPGCDYCFGDSETPIRYLSDQGWGSETEPADRRLAMLYSGDVQAWMNGQPSGGDPWLNKGTLLLAPDWSVLDRWLVWAAGCRYPVVGAITTEPCEGLDLLAVVAHPEWPGQWSRTDVLAFTAGSWDVGHRAAFRNLLMHSVSRNDQRCWTDEARRFFDPVVTNFPGYVRQLLDTVGAEPAHQKERVRGERLLKQFCQHLYQDWTWRYRSSFEGGWSLTSGQHRYRYHPGEQVLTYGEQPPLKGVELPGLQAGEQTWRVSYQPWGVLTEQVHSWRLNLRADGENWKIGPTVSPAAHLQPGKRLEVAYVEQRRVVLAESLEQAGGLSLGLTAAALPQREPAWPRPIPWLLLIVANRARAEHYLAQMDGRPEPVMAAWEERLCARLVTRLQPDLILFDPELMRQQQDEGIQRLAGRLQSAYSFLPDMPRLPLPEQGLKEFLEQLTPLGRSSPQRLGTLSKMAQALEKFQQDLSQCRSCTVHNQLDGSWSADLRQPDVRYAWSNQTKALEVAVPNKMGGVRLQRLAGPLRSRLENSGQNLCFYLYNPSSQFFSAPALELTFSISRDFLQEPSLTPSGWCYVS